MLRTKRWFLVVVLVLFIAGCWSSNERVIETTYDTLKTFQEAYILSKAVVKEYAKAGKISKEDQAKLIELSESFLLAYHTAVDALEMYKKVGDSNSEDKMRATFDEARDKFYRLMKRLNPLVGG